MTEANSAEAQETKEVSPGKMTRRDFLKGSAAIIGGTVVASVIGTVGSRLLRRELDNAYKEKIERRFHIQLKTVKEVTDESKEYSSVHWNSRTLDFMEKSLSQLPPHLYQSDAKGRPTTIILDESGGTLCRCGKSTYPHAIEIGIGSKSIDVQRDFSKYFGFLAHEFTHLLTLDYDPNTDRFSLRKNYDKIDEILGVKFPEVRPKLLEQVGVKLRPLMKFPPPVGFKVPIIFIAPRDDLTKSQLEAFDFYNEFNQVLVNYTAIKEKRPESEIGPEEFIGGLGGHYVRGKGYFFKYYSEFFDPGTVERLYNFTRDDIYRGKEY